MPCILWQKKKWKKEKQRNQNKPKVKSTQYLVYIIGDFVACTEIKNQLLLLSSTNFLSSHKRKSGDEDYYLCKEIYIGFSINNTKWYWWQVLSTKH